MNKHILFLILFVSTTFFSFSQYRIGAGFITMKSETSSDIAIAYKHLKIYPLIGGTEFQKAHKDIGKFTNLEQALKEEKVKIFEVGSENLENNEQIRVNVVNEININPQTNQTEQIDLNETQNVDVQISQTNVPQQQMLSNQGIGGQVNKLYIKNLSQDTIYLMAGEVIKGGKQDRILAQDMIIPPNADKIDLSVFCVENNRWSVSSGGKASFDQYYSVATNSVRKQASKSMSQQEVWAAVDKVISKNQAETSTKTYTALEDSKEYTEKLEDYSEYFFNAFKKVDNCIGFVGVTGDKIIGCDIFATVDLFEKQSKHLLNSYITEAITEGGEITVKDNEVKEYLADFLTDETSQDAVIDEKGVQFKHGNKKLHITTY